MIRFALALLLFASVMASTPEVSFSGETTSIVVNLTASGSRTALKLDDTTCQFGFPGLVEDPQIQVTSDDQVVSTNPLGTGDWSMPAETALCKSSIDVDIPKSGAFQITIAPYFDKTYELEDIADQTLAIDLSRGSGDPFPISPIPTGGPIDGTDNVRIVGFFELSGTEFEDYMNGPIVGCMGMGGYSDIQAGMQITIKDESGTIIGITDLKPDPTEDMPVNCKFYFVAEVPVSTFYTFESGRRGSLTYSHEDIENSNWTVTLGIG